MTNTLGAKPTIDTSSFQSGISQMNRDMALLKSGFLASAASLGDWSNSASGLESRMKLLTGTIDIQKNKVSSVRAEWERVKAEKGENSRAAQELEIKLNKETETLGKMQYELGTTDQALQEMKTNTDDAGNSLDEMGSNAESTSGNMDGLKTALAGVTAVAQGVVTAVLAVAAAAIAVAGAVAGLVFSSAAAAGGLEDMSAKTGIGVERLQELEFIGNQVGVSIDTISGAQAKLTRSMNEGRDGTGKQADAFKALGVSVTDAQGNLRNTQDVFGETIDALGKIQNPAERDAMAMDIFGKSAMELNPLVKEGSAGMAAMAEQAHELGAVMSEEDVTSLAAFDDMLAGLKDGLKGTLGTLATAFLPTFTLIFGQVSDTLKVFKDIVTGADGDFGKLATGLGGLVGTIATNIAAQAPQMIEAGLAIMKSILDALISALPSLLNAGITIITSLVGFIVAALPSLIQAGIQILLAIIDAIVKNLPMLITAALQAIIALANGIAAALPTLIPAIVQAVITIVQTLLENLPMLIGAALALIIGLAQGLIAALPILTAAMPEIVSAIFTALIASLPMIGTAALELLKIIYGGIIANLPLLGESAVKVIDALYKGMTGLQNKWLEVGKNLVTGIWNGISGNVGWLLGNVMGFANGIVQAVKDALLIESPSKKGIEIGRNFISSIALGGDNAMQDVSRAFADMTGQLNMSAIGGMGAGGASISSTDNSVDVWGNVIISGDGNINQSIRAKRI